MRLLQVAGGLIVAMTVTVVAVPTFLLVQGLFLSPEEVTAGEEFWKAQAIANLEHAETTVRLAEQLLEMQRVCELNLESCVLDLPLNPPLEACEKPRKSRKKH